MTRVAEWAETPISQAPPPPTRLLRDYLDQVKSFCGAEGVYPQPFLQQDVNGSITLTAIAADGGMCLDLAEKVLASGQVAELIFGLDRSAVPGQGLEFDDFVTVVWYVDGEFYTAVIDYKPAEDEADVVIREPNWNNNWWNNEMRDGLLPMLRKALGEAPE